MQKQHHPPHQRLPLQKRHPDILLPSFQRLVQSLEEKERVVRKEMEGHACKDANFKYTEHHVGCSMEKDQHFTSLGTNEQIK